MSTSRRGAWAGLVSVVLLSLAVVAVPVILIRPFSPQTPASMSLAFTLRRRFDPDGRPSARRGLSRS